MKIFILFVERQQAVINPKKCRVVQKLLFWVTTRISHTFEDAVIGPPAPCFFPVIGSSRTRPKPSSILGSVEHLLRSQSKTM